MVHFRVSHADRRAIRALAFDEGIKPAEWIRRAVHASLQSKGPSETDE